MKTSYFFVLFMCLSVFAPADVRGQGQEVPFDLSTWTQEGSGNWEISDSDGDGIPDQVLQTSNPITGNGIAFFVSAQTLGPGNELNGRFSVSSADRDDDYMGFVFGYHDSSNYYVCQWKREDQRWEEWEGLAEAGISILRVRGLAPSEETTALLWQAVQTPGVTVLAKWTTSTGGTGWIHGEVYTYKISLFESAFRVVIRRSDSSLVYDSGVIPVGEPIHGRFGFYNLSQPQVTYSGFTVKETPPAASAGCLVITDAAFEVVTAMELEGRYPLIRDGSAPLGTADGELIVALGESGLPTSSVSSVSMIEKDGTMRPIGEVPEASEVNQILSIFFCGKSSFAVIVGPAKSVAMAESSYCLSIIKGPFQASAVRHSSLPEWRPVLIMRKEDHRSGSLRQAQDNARIAPATFHPLALGIR